MSIFDIGRYKDEISRSNIYCSKVKKNFEAEVKLREHDFETISEDYSKIVERVKEQFAMFENLKKIYFEVEPSEENFSDNKLSNLPKGIQTENISSESISPTMSGLGAGLGVGVGAVGLITAFGTAGTGAAISGLTGIFWIKATLAALGGGTIASGGFGMVGGIAILGGAIFLPAIAVAGYFAHDKIKSAHKNAMKQMDEARRLEKESKNYFAEIDKGVRLLREMNYEFRTSADFFQRLIKLSIVSPAFGHDEDFQKILQDAAQVVKNFGLLKVLDKENNLNDKFKEELSTAENSLENCREQYISFRVKISSQVLELTERVKNSELQTLKDEEIRAAFDEAVNSAQVELDITAMKLNEFTKSYIPQFRSLLERGVTIKIFYGIGKKNSNENYLTRTIAKNLKREFNNYPNFHMRRTNTHTKIFICDDKFFVLSSYNVLTKDGELYTFGEAGLRSNNAELILHHRKEYFNF